MIRLDRLLCNTGYTTRSKIKQYLRKNEVLVGSERTKHGSLKVDPTQITINQKKIPFIPPVTLMMHKPAQHICSRSRDFPKANIIFDLLPIELSMLSNPVLSVAGRLDIDVTGLVILSQDGDLVAKIISNKEDAMPKEYIVTTKHPLRGNEAESVTSGLQLRNETLPLKAARWEQLDSHQVKITIWEGRYHQVVRMVAALGNSVSSIHRSRIGPMRLGDLPSGEWRLLSREEVESVRRWTPSDPLDISPPVPTPPKEEPEPPLFTPKEEEMLEALTKKNKPR